MKPGPRLATSPPLHSEPGYATQFGSVDGETDGEADRVCVREIVTEAENDRVSLALFEIEREMLNEALVDANTDALPERDPANDAESDSDAGFDGLVLSLRVIERDELIDRDVEALCEADTELERVPELLTLGVRVADRDGDGRHWQHALKVVRQLSSLSAPVAKSPGDSTPRHVPAPVGAGWPTDGVPHRLALFAKKYAVDTPDAHVQLFTAARLVVGPAADDAPVQ